MVIMGSQDSRNGREIRVQSSSTTEPDSEDSSGELPFVSVVVPIRNEADFIVECLQSILRNRYPPEKLEVLVVDGLSTDGTREIIQQLMLKDSRVRLLDNPERIVPHAMNRAIAAARGEIITRVDGHADVADDFIANSVRVLRETPGCWCAGGSIETISETRVGQIIAACMSTPVGVGNARFRLQNYEGFVDTIAFGSYWKWVFDRIGNFDEELVRNQDDELNARLIRHGGRIFMSRLIRCRYYPRTSLRKLWRQYYQYGFWRIRTIQKLGRPATLRQLVPLAFVTVLLGLAITALIFPPARPILWICLGLYLGALIAGAIPVGRRTGLAGFLLAPVVFMILHFGYGLGCLWGILRFVILRSGRIEEKMSR